MEQYIFIYIVVGFLSGGIVPAIVLNDERKTKKQVLLWPPLYILGILIVPACLLGLLVIVYPISWLIKQGKAWADLPDE